MESLLTMSLCPSRAIPVDQFNDLFRGARLTVGQQAPFERLDARRRPDLARNDTGRGNPSSLAVRNLDAACRESDHQ
jgi:hypothetical protein